MKIPLHTHCQACKEVQGEIRYHAFKSHHYLQEQDLNLATLAFSPDNETGKYLPFLVSQAKQPPPWGNFTAPGSARCPFLPFLFHITHVSHQTSYLSLQQMHSLPPAREKAATTQCAATSLQFVPHSGNSKRKTLLVLRYQLLLSIKG